MATSLPYHQCQNSDSQNPVGISLDLHGLRAEEALEKADKFISDCLLAGYDEVLIYHGIGSGILSKVIKDFLSTHPKVVSFCDAPPQMGGFGAKENCKTLKL